MTRLPPNPEAGGAGPPESRTGGRLTREQFARLYEANWRSLWCVAAAVLSDRSQAEDAVQEAAVIAMQKLHEFEPTTSFLAWMSRIVRYVSLNEGRRRARRRAAPLNLADPEGATPPPPRDEFDAALERAVGDLDETARACLLLRIVAGLSYKHIAATLAIPEGTAMSHVHRSRQALRARLSAPQNPGGRS